MKLYSGPLSLFSRKVEIALHEKGLAFERIMVRFTQTEGYHPKRPDVLAANPGAKCPFWSMATSCSTIPPSSWNISRTPTRTLPCIRGMRRSGRAAGSMNYPADEVMLVPLRALMHRTAPRPSDPERWASDEAKAASAAFVLKDQLRALDRRLQGRSYLRGNSASPTSRCS